MKETLLSHIPQLFFGVVFDNVCINPLKDAINNLLTFKTTRNAKKAKYLTLIKSLFVNLKFCAA